MTTPKPPSVPLRPVPGVLRCTINQVLAGQRVVNTLHVANQSGVAWTQADADSMVNAMRAAWVTNVIPKQCKDITLGKVVGIDLTSNLGVVATSTGADVPGTVFAGSLPANVAMCISWPIARHYKGGHPRTYLAGFDQTLVQNANTWTPAAVTSFVGAMAAVRTACNAVVVAGGGVALCVVHRGPKKAPFPVPTIDFLGVPSSDGGIDSQRRRLGKR
jgi:hypothetical protein